MRDLKLIKDPDVRNALETLITEFENLESTVEEKDEDIKDRVDECIKLEAQIEELQAKVEELEEALAEAYLTSELTIE